MVNSFFQVYKLCYGRTPFTCNIVFAGHCWRLGDMWVRVYLWDAVSWAILITKKYPFLFGSMQGPINTLYWLMLWKLIQAGEIQKIFTSEFMFTNNYLLNWHIFYIWTSAKIFKHSLIWLTLNNLIDVNPIHCQRFPNLFTARGVGDQRPLE